MVFENVTLFEVHVDGTELDAFFGGGEDVEGDAVLAETDGTGVDDATEVAEGKPGASRKRRYVAVLGLAVVGGVAARRLRRRRAGRAVGVDVEAAESDGTGGAVAPGEAVEQ
ncbi:hypothetical protein [Halorientalis salina]|uniref:hypothetical protein n=1 Tax=Halorientalis salina TaxID=2932266 RepID=UPI0010AC1977|nr:hypothetical protein [Halorientalis salina]